MTRDIKILLQITNKMSGDIKILLQNPNKINKMTRSKYLCTLKNTT